MDVELSYSSTCVGESVCQKFTIKSLGGHPSGEFTIKSLGGHPSG